MTPAARRRSTGTATAVRAFPAERIGDGSVPEELVRLTNAAINASHILGAIDSEALAELELTPAQYRVLEYLGSNGPAKAVALVDALDVSQSTISRTCDRLVKKGLVSRRASRTDRREIRLSVTRLGFEALEALPLLRRKKVGEMLGKVPGQSRSQVTEALELLAGAHRELTAGGGPKAC